MISSVKTPQPGNLIVQAMARILRQIIRHGNDQAAPEKRHPRKLAFQVRNREWQDNQAEVSNGGCNRIFGRTKQAMSRKRSFAVQCSSRLKFWYGYVLAEVARRRSPEARLRLF